jgi:hypothetical protein
MIFQLVNGKKPTDEKIASRASLVIAWHFMTVAKLSFMDDDYKAALSQYTHACFAADAAGDSFIKAEVMRLRGEPSYTMNATMRLLARSKNCPWMC